MRSEVGSDWDRDDFRRPPTLAESIVRVKQMLETRSCDVTSLRSRLTIITFPLAAAARCSVKACRNYSDDAPPRIHYSHLYRARSTIFSVVRSANGATCGIARARFRAGIEEDPSLERTDRVRRDVAEDLGYLACC